jgi:hypothetical protein
MLFIVRYGLPATLIVAGFVLLKHGHWPDEGHEGGQTG